MTTGEGPDHSGPSPVALVRVVGRCGFCLVELANGAKSRSASSGNAGILRGRVRVGLVGVDLGFELCGLRQDGDTLFGDRQVAPVNGDAQVVLALSLNPHHRVIDELCSMRSFCQVVATPPTSTTGATAVAIVLLPLPLMFLITHTSPYVARSYNR